MQGNCKQSCNLLSSNHSRYAEEGSFHHLPDEEATKLTLIKNQTVHKRKPSKFHKTHLIKPPTQLISSIQKTLLSFFSASHNKNNINKKNV